MLTPAPTSKLFTSPMRGPSWFPRRILRQLDDRPDVSRNGELPANGKDERLMSPFDLTCTSQSTTHTPYPNRWAKIREDIREPAAELLGTMILIIVGTGVNCQFALSADPNVSPSPKGSYLGFNITWGCAAALGVWVSGGVSGGHINPAVTFCMAIFRGLPWFKVFTYILGQIIGAWIGALVVFANYSGAIDIFEGGAGQRTLKTAGLFSTYPLTYVSSANCFFDEFIGTFILVFVVFAISDRHNTALHPSLVPLVIFFVITGIGAAFGMQTGYAINPARDLGPRIMTAMVGYGSQVFTFRHHYWIWGPIIASCCGGLVAGLLYDLFIYRGPESPINRPNAGARASFAMRQVQGRNRSPAREEPLTPMENLPLEV